MGWYSLLEKYQPPSGVAKGVGGCMSPIVAGY